MNKADYYPYGDRLFSSGSIGKYSYNGKEYVDDYGFDLYYYGARFMDPKTGRFITPDPIQDYLNQYSYVGNNPVNRIDPTGMRGMPTSDLIAIVPAIAFPRFFFELSDAEFYALTTDPYDPSTIFNAAKKIKTALIDILKAASNYANNGVDSERQDWADLAKTINDLLLDINKVIESKGYLNQVTLDNIMFGNSNPITFNRTQGLLEINAAAIPRISANKAFFRAGLVHEIAHMSYTRQHPNQKYSDDLTHRFAVKFEFRYYSEYGSLDYPSYGPREGLLQNAIRNIQNGATYMDAFRQYYASQFGLGWESWDEYHRRR